jgi:hypothetical protein
MSKMGLTEVLPFGKKHTGKTVEQIYKQDAEYLCWLRQAKKNDGITFFDMEVNLLLDDFIESSPKVAKKFTSWNTKLLLESKLDPRNEQHAYVVPEPPAPVVTKEDHYQDQWGAY